MREDSPYIMNPARYLSNNDRLAGELQQQVDALCQSMNAEAEAAKSRGESEVTFPVTGTFALNFPNPKISQTYVYGMLVEELVKQGYTEVTYTPPVKDNTAYIHFSWPCDYNEAAMKRYASLLRQHSTV